MSFTHYIEGIQVYPVGDWSIENREIDGCIFPERKFEGKMTVGNGWFNKQGSDDYDYLMSFAECQRLDYEIKCNGATYWKGYIAHPIGYDVDTDKCLITFEPKPFETDYDCIMYYADEEYDSGKLSGLFGTEALYFYDLPGGAPFDIIESVNYGLQLKDILDYILKNVGGMNCFSGNIVSSFLYLDDYPDGTTPAVNYITGAANNWDELVFVSISHVRQAFGSTEVTGADVDITFSELMGFLRDALNLYWYIDANGDFRIEHLHYFDRDFASRANTLLPDDVDLTAVTNKNTGNPVTWRKDHYSYLEEYMVSEEDLELAGYDGDDFTGYPVIYDENCTANYPRKSRKLYEHSKYMTDVQMLLDDPDSVTAEGLLVVSAKYKSIITDTNAITAWTNSNYDTWSTPGDHRINQAVNIGSPPLKYCYSNNFAVTAGNVYTLYYHVPVGGYAGIPQANIVNAGTGASVTVEGYQTILSNAGYLTLTFTISASIANAQVRIQENSAGGGSFGNLPADPAIFYLNRNVERWYCQWDTGVITAALGHNRALAKANMMENFWQHGRVLLEGTMNDTARTIAGGNAFETVKRNRKQVVITAPLCCDPPEWFAYYLTGLGYGRPQSITEKDGYYEIELLHE